MRYRTAALSLLIFASLSALGKAQTVSGQCTLTGRQWTISAQTDIPLSQEAIGALKSGIVLYFQYVIDIRETDSWFSPKTEITHSLRLRYNHLTLSYQLENPVTLSQQNFASADDALQAIGTLENLPLIDSRLLAGRPYSIKMRLEFETDRLPFSLRLSALTSHDWDLSSGWWLCPQKTSG